jgi:hypothetical protein
MDQPDFTPLVNMAQQNNQLLAKIQQTLAAVFPQATGTDSTATGGAATLPANPVGFIEVYVPSLSATVKIPYYST